MWDELKVTDAKDKIIRFYGSLSNAAIKSKSVNNFTNNNAVPSIENLLFKHLKLSKIGLIR